MIQNKYRWLYMLGLGLLLSLMFRFIIFCDFHQHSYLLDLVFTSALSILVWEGNLQLDAFLNKKLPWQINAGKRVLVQALVALLFNGTVLLSSMWMYHIYLCLNNAQADQLMRGSFIIAMFLSFAILAVEVGMQFYKNWRHSLIEAERYKTESTQAQLQNLKNQVNPHFLFNNLSVLNSLVYQDQDKAAEFIQQLAKMYRYVLDQRNTELVSLESELQFLEHYLFLLKIRFGKSLVVEQDIHADCLPKLLPPLCLQMLVENAIKHNEVSIAKPLTVFIRAQHDHLLIKNNIQPRVEEEPASKTGIKNMKTRYAFFTEEEIQVVQNQNTFEVILPLLSNS
jgi:two-component system, LytTR family, sensor kinase